MPRLLHLSFLVFFTAGLVNIAHAQTNSVTHQTWITTRHDGTHVYQIVYADQDQYALDTYQQEPGRMQEKTGHWTFQYQYELEYFRQILSATETSQWYMTGPEYSLEEGDLVTEVSDDTLWTPTNEWNWEWEKKYAAWVEEKIDPEFFSTYHIRTDCADVAYASRWIFARIHGLPMGSRLAGSNRIFTHASMRAAWKSLPTSDDWAHDQRFLTALDYLLDNTYTHTLWADSYPVSINAQEFIPGIHHLYLGGDSGHTHFVTSASTEAFVIWVNSTVPRELRVLDRGPFLEQYPPNQGADGFLRFRWLEINGDSWRLKTPESHPSYSLEQYSPELMNGFDSFFQALYSRLNIPLDFNAAANASAAQLKKLFSTRIEVVKNGYLYCQEHACHPGTPGWEDYSTPSRDKQILKIFDNLNWMWNQVDPDTQTNLINEMYEAIYEVLPNPEEGLPTIISIANFTDSIRPPSRCMHVDPRLPVASRWCLDQDWWPKNTSH